MGLITGLARLGLTAGAVYGAMKVSDRYKENNPDGVSDTSAKIEEIKKAAEQVYAQAAEYVKEKAPGVQSAVEQKVQQFSDFASEKAPEVMQKVQGAVDSFAQKAPDIAEKVQGFVGTVTDKVSGYADAVAGKAAAEQHFEDVVDADFAPVEEENKEE